MEVNDIYDAFGNQTGRTHLRGTPWQPGEYGLVVCVWVYDGKGKILLTRRAPEKSFPGTWENSGGAAKAGEDALTAIARELFEETGIRAEKSEFQYLGKGQDPCTHYRYFALCRDVPIKDIVLLPGETDAAMWADFDTVHSMVETGEICEIIGREFLRWEEKLRGDRC